MQFLVLVWPFWFTTVLMNRCRFVHQLRSLCKIYQNLIRTSQRNKKMQRMLGKWVLTALTMHNSCTNILVFVVCEKFYKLEKLLLYFLFIFLFSKGCTGNYILYVLILHSAWGGNKVTLICIFTLISFKKVRP